MADADDARGGVRVSKTHGKAKHARAVKNRRRLRSKEGPLHSPEAGFP
jgi:hypothetical protein